MSELKLDETKPKRMVSRNVAIALGIISVVVVAGLAGAFAYYHYTPIIGDKDITISSLNVEISQLNSKLLSLQEQVEAYNSTINSLKANVTYLQDQLNGLLNVTVIPIGIITSNPSAWVNRTVVVEGVLSMIAFPIFEDSPWSMELSSGSQTIGVSFSANVNQSSLWNQTVSSSASVMIYGVVNKGLITFLFGSAPNIDTYYIEAEIVEPI